MSLEIAPASRSGLAIVWDVIVAPKTAFTALRERTHWGWAFSIVSVLGTIGAILQTPAGEHLVAATFAHQSIVDPQMQTLTPEQREHALGYAKLAQHYSWIALPLIVLLASLIAASLFTIANAVGNGGSSFGRLFGLACNISLINFGIGYLLVGVLAARVGPDAISTQRDLSSLMPSLVRLAPANAPKLAALLASINPFQIWSFVLILLGLRTMTKLAAPYVWATAIVVGFGNALFAAAFAR